MTIMSDLHPGANTGNRECWACWAVAFLNEWYFKGVLEGRFASTHRRNRQNKNTHVQCTMATPVRAAQYKKSRTGNVMKPGILQALTKSAWIVKDFLP